MNLNYCYCCEPVHAAGASAIGRANNSLSATIKTFLDNHYRQIEDFKNTPFRFVFIMVEMLIDVGEAVFPRRGNGRNGTTSTGFNFPLRVR